MSQGSGLPWDQEKLPGGLPLIWQQRTGPDIVAARLWIRGGSSGDPLGQRGAHQLLAGLLSRGCGSLDADALADLVEGCGAVLRAEALEDSLVLSLKCATADAAELVPLLLTGCLRRISGTYKDASGQVSLEFHRDGKVYAKVFGVPMVGDFEEKDNKIIFKGPQGEMFIDIVDANTLSMSHPLKTGGERGYLRIATE